MIQQAAERGLIRFGFSGSRGFSTDVVLFEAHIKYFFSYHLYGSAKFFGDFDSGVFGVEFSYPGEFFGSPVIGLDDFFKFQLHCLSPDWPGASTDFFAYLSDTFCWEHSFEGSQFLRRPLWGLSYSFDAGAYSFVYD